MSWCTKHPVTHTAHKQIWICLTGIPYWRRRASLKIELRVRLITFPNFVCWPRLIARNVCELFRKTLDWGGKGGAILRAQTQKRFWRDSIYSCNQQLRESFSVCSIEIVSLRYRWIGPTDKFQKCLPKQNTFKSVLEIQNTFKSVLPKHFLCHQNTFVFWP